MVNWEANRGDHQKDGQCAQAHTAPDAGFHGGDDGSRKYDRGVGELTNRRKGGMSYEDLAHDKGWLKAKRGVEQCHLRVVNLWQRMDRLCRRPGHDRVAYRQYPCSGRNVEQ